MKITNEFGGRGRDGQTIYLALRNICDADDNVVVGIGEMVISRDNDGINPYITYAGETVSMSTTARTASLETIEMAPDYVVGDVVVFDSEDWGGEDIVGVIETNDNSPVYPFNVRHLTGPEKGKAEWIRSSSVKEKLDTAPRASE